jgi:hypothetical protein
MNLAADEFLTPAAELVSCGLPKPCILRLSKLVSLHRQIIVKRIGAWPGPTLAVVMGRMREIQRLLDPLFTPKKTRA